MIRTNIEMPTKKFCILGLAPKVTDIRDFVLKTIFVMMMVMILHKDKDDYQARSRLRRQVHDWTRQSAPPTLTLHNHHFSSLFLRYLGHFAASQFLCFKSFFWTLV